MKLKSTSQFYPKKIIIREVIHLVVILCRFPLTKQLNDVLPMVKKHFKEL